MNDAVIAAKRPAGKGPVDLSQPLKLYWVPGCTSCLRMKEFFTRHGVAFVSVNALEDQAAFDELAALGIKRVPIARRGGQWADGQLLSELAWIGGIELKQRKILAPAVLADRAERIQGAARTLLARIPAERLGENLPKRPRSYKQLGCHIFQIMSRRATTCCGSSARCTSASRPGGGATAWERISPDPLRSITGSRRCTTSWSAPSGIRPSTRGSCARWSPSWGSRPRGR
jgi:hypothetical protein